MSPSFALFLAEAGEVDVVDAPTYTWLPDHGMRAFGATPSPLPGLGAWHLRAELVAAALEGSDLADGWARHVAGSDLPRLLQEVERATDEEWAELQTLAASYDVQPGLVDGLDVVARALLRLAAQGRRDDLRLLDAELVRWGDDLPTRVEGADVFVEWRSVGLPAADRRLGEDETALRAQVVAWIAAPSRGGPRSSWRSRSVDLAPGSTLVTVQDETGAALPVEPLPAAEATRWAGRRFQSAVGVWVAVPAGTSTLRLTVATQQLRRSGVVSIPEPPPTVEQAGLTVHDVELESEGLVLGAVGDLESLRLLDRTDQEVAVRFGLAEAGSGSSSSWCRSGSAGPCRSPPDPTDWWLRPTPDS